MNICEAYNYQGISSCLWMLKKAQGVIMTDKGTTSSKVNWIDLTANKVIVAATGAETGIYLSFQRGATRTTDDPEVTTSNLNYKEKTMDSLPSLRGFLKASMCDYVTLFGADNKEFDFRLVTEDNKIGGTNQSDGTVKGFRGHIAVRYDLAPDNAQEAYPVDIYFSDISEFKDPYYDQASFKPSELTDAVPVGVTLSLNTAYTGGDVIVNSKLRCTETAYSAFDATSNWTVINSNANDVAVTVVSTTNGQNTLTIKKDSSGTPANLASTDWVQLQGAENDGTYDTYISDILKVWGGT